MYSPRSAFNRSLSSPDLSCLNDKIEGGGSVLRRVQIVEQHFTGNFQPISYRQISCEQIYDPKNCALALPRSGGLQTDFVSTPNIYPSIDTINLNVKPEWPQIEDITPMDIDEQLTPCQTKQDMQEINVGEHRKRRIKNLRTNETIDLTDTSMDEMNPDDVNATVINKNVDQPRKRIIKNLRTNEVQTIGTSDTEIENRTVLTTIQPQKSQSIFSFVTKLIALVGIVGLIIVVLQSFFIFEDHDKQLAQIKLNLTDQVIGQNIAIKAIIQSLETRNNRPKNIKNIKIIGLIGTSGVGKTFIANILKANFKAPLIHDMVGHDLGKVHKEKTIVKAILPSACNLVVIDDLIHEDSEAMFSFVDSLPKDCCITVLIIYNIHTTDNDLNYSVNYKAIDVIRKDFDESKTDHELVVLNEFDDSIAEEYLQNILKAKGVPKNMFKVIIGQILKVHNVKAHGLKGLHSKVLTFIESLNKF